MNVFDLSILRFFSTLSHRSETLDALIVWAVSNSFIKGGILMALFWWAWAGRDDERFDKREYLLLGFGLSIFAVVVARVVALSLPFRTRPLHTPDLGLQLPYTMDRSALETWSSFPSDHAVVFSCLTATLWMASRPLGNAAALYVLVVVFLPRMYTGLHYPTDILAGAALGCAVFSLTKIESLRATLARPALCWMEKQPGPFYGLLFLATFELAELFRTLRMLAQPVTHLIKPLLQGLH